MKLLNSMGTDLAVLRAGCGIKGAQMRLESESTAGDAYAILRDWWEDGHRRFFCAVQFHFLYPSSGIDLPLYTRSAGLGPDGQHAILSLHNVLEEGRLEELDAVKHIVPHCVRVLEVL